MKRLILLLAACHTPVGAARSPVAVALPERAEAQVWPDATAALPANATWIVLAFSAPVARERLQSLRLVDGRVEMGARWLWSEADAKVDGAVMWGPFSDPRCSATEGERLCEGHDYDLLLGVDTLARFHIGPARVVGPQWLGAGSVFVSDTGARLVRATDGPCVIAAAALDLGRPGEVFDPNAGAVITRLRPDTDYDWQVACTDAAGHSSAAWPVHLHTLPAQDLRLGELVVEPRHDWNDSQGATGTPFDGNALPVDKASPTDEWAELWNAGTTTIDLSGYVLQVQDGSPSSTTLWQSEGFPPLKAGSTLAPDARIVVRLSPAGENATNKASVLLLDPLGLVRDRVDLGVAGVPNGDSHSDADESVSACGDKDTRNWRKTPATPGATNACPADENVGNQPP